MKIKTSELVGRPLDWAVVKANGDIDEIIQIGPGMGETPAVVIDEYGLLLCMRTGERPNCSISWQWGGPIIEREEIDIYCHESPKSGCGWWEAEITGTKVRQRGQTPLVAAMRCFVELKLGKEVDVPEEIL